MCSRLNREKFAFNRELFSLRRHIFVFSGHPAGVHRQKFLLSQVPGVLSRRFSAEKVPAEEKNVPVEYENVPADPKNVPAEYEFFLVEYKFFLAEHASKPAEVVGTMEEHNRILAESTNRRGTLAPYHKAHLSVGVLSRREAERRAPARPVEVWQGI